MGVPNWRASREGVEGTSGVAGEDLCEHGVVCCVNRLCQL